MQLSNNLPAVPVLAKAPRQIGMNKENQQTSDSFVIQWTATQGLSVLTGPQKYVRREPKKLETKNQMAILAESLYDMANFYSEEDHGGLVGKHANAFVYIAEAAKNASEGRQWMGENKWR